MKADNIFEIQAYNFNSNLFNEFQNIHSAKDFWPIVYILSGKDGDKKEAYVGETTDTYARMYSHLKNKDKDNITAVHLITSEKFNKSATRDIESNLIKYMSGDGLYTLSNLAIGLSDHNYYEKPFYWEVFKSIWTKLKNVGITKHSIEHVSNSDLFKYSPYKSLNPDQKNGLLAIMKSLLSDDVKNIVIEGGAGTGKSILAIFLFKLLNTNNEDFNFKEFGEEENEFIDLVLLLKKKYPEPKMALVVPMASFRNTLKEVFKNIKGLNAGMVVGPAEVAKKHFHIIIVDEAHRLRRRVNLEAYFRVFDVVTAKLNLDKSIHTELDWVIKQSDKAILFYDKNQSIKPSDVPQSDFDKLKSYNTTEVKYLKSQLRVKGANDYVKYISNLLDCKLSSSNKVFNSKEYEFVSFDAIDDMISEIKKRNGERGLSRLIAGYSWKWISNKKGNETKLDIQIENTHLKWNSVNSSWVNSPDSINEVGCIHTTQGYDLNYAGIIFGNEISYDKVKDEIVILKEHYFDTTGKISINNPAELKDYIINIYKTIMLRGIKGTYVYACDKNLREYLSKHIINYKPRKKTDLSEMVVMPFKNAVPLYDLKAAAGNFSELQVVPENINDYNWAQLPGDIQYSENLFACTVLGESMNKMIPNGSVCLFRKYSGGSRNGKIVLVQHTEIHDTDFGSGYTVKQYTSIKKTTEEGYSHESITLKPMSYNSGFNDIKISEDESENLKVIGIFERVL